jgi:hypothetical protein
MQHETVSAMPISSTLSSSNWQTLENNMGQVKRLVRFERAVAIQVVATGFECYAMTKGRH